MNFQTVKNANGQLASIFGWVMEVGTSKLNVKQKPYQQVKIRDDTGEEHTVTINKGQGELLTNNELNTRQQFSMQTYQGQYGVNYSGFWSTARVNQAPPPPQQAPAPKQAVPAAALGKSDETKIIDTCVRTAKDLVLGDKIPLKKLQDVAAELIFFSLGRWKEFSSADSETRTNPQIPEQIPEQDIPFQETKMEICPDCGNYMDCHRLGCCYESKQPLRETIKQLQAENKRLKERNEQLEMLLDQEKKINNELASKP